MARIPLRGGQFTRDRRLDRLVSFDEASRSFPVRAAISAAARPRSYTWSLGYWLNQGREGACTGFAVSHEAGARPVIINGLTDQSAQALYRRAQQLDEWPGEDYEGSSVLAAVKAGQERGWYKQYRWAFGIDDVLLALGYKGPVVFGLNWYDGMYEPDSKGFVHPTGRWVGGHAITGYKISIKAEYVEWRNSWGKDWGPIQGNCRISFKDLDRLLREDGEACVPVLRTKPASQFVKLEN